MKQKIIGNEKGRAILEKNEKRNEVKWSGLNANGRMVPHMLYPYADIRSAPYTYYAKATHTTSHNQFLSQRRSGICTCNPIWENRA